MRKTSGISLLLLIFLSLCLMTFALLSLSSASADYKLSEKSAQRTTEYYAADAAANQMLAEIDQRLCEALLQAESDKTPYDIVAAKLLSDMDSSISYDAALHMITYSVTINEKQDLLIEIEVIYPQSQDDALYRIHKWQIVNTTQWTPDTHIPVYQRQENES